MSTLSNNQRRLLRRGARIQAAYTAWKAVGSPRIAIWLDNFSAEDEALRNDIIRVKEANEAVILHRVAWSLHYHHSTAPSTDRVDWIARVSPEDSALVVQVLASAAVPDVTEESDYEDMDVDGGNNGPGASRESKWWKFKDVDLPESLATTHGAAALDSGNDVYIDVDAEAATIRPSLAPGVVPAARSDHRNIFRSSTLHATGASALAHTLSPSRSARSLSTSHAVNASLGGRHDRRPLTGTQERVQGGDYGAGTVSHGSMNKGLEKIFNILRTSSRNGSENREASSTRSVPRFRQRTDSSSPRIIKNVPSRQSSRPCSRLPRHHTFETTPIIPRKRKRARFDVDGLETDDSSSDSSSHTDSENDSGSFRVKRRRVSTRAVERTEDLDDCASTPEGDGSGSGDDYRDPSLTRGTAIKLKTTEQATSVDISAAAKTGRPKYRSVQSSPFTRAEVNFIAQASKVKLGPCDKCAEDVKECIQNEVGYSCKGCRNKYKCSHVAKGNTGGIRLTPSHYWETLLRHARRPIPILPPVPYLFPLDKVDELDVDHAELIAKLRYPKTIEEALIPLDPDEILGLANPVTQAALMEVHSDHRRRSPPRLTLSTAVSQTKRTTNFTGSETVCASVTATNETSHAISTLRDEIEILRLEISRQKDITTSRGLRLSEQGNSAPPHSKRIDTLEGHLADIHKFLHVLVAKVSDMAELYRKMETEITDSHRRTEKQVAESHRKMEKQAEHSREQMQGITAAIESSLAYLTAPATERDALASTHVAASPIRESGRVGSSASLATSMFETCADLEYDLVRDDP